MCYPHEGYTYLNGFIGFIGMEFHIYTYLNGFIGFIGLKLDRDLCTLVYIEI